MRGYSFISSLQGINTFNAQNMRYRKIFRAIPFRYTLQNTAIVDRPSAYEHPVEIFAENQPPWHLKGGLFANDTINGVSTIDSPICKPICRGVIYDTHWSPKA